MKRREGDTAGKKNTHRTVNPLLSSSVDVQQLLLLDSRILIVACTGYDTMFVRSHRNASDGKERVGATRVEMGQRQNRGGCRGQQHGDCWKSSGSQKAGMERSL